MGTDADAVRRSEKKCAALYADIPILIIVSTTDTIKVIKNKSISTKSALKCTKMH